MAVNAKNSFINVSGFSQHRLMYGKNISLPSSLNDKLFAGYLEIPLVLEHLNVLYSSCQAFMKIESSNKLKHSLSLKINKRLKILKVTLYIFDFKFELYPCILS